MKKLMLTKEEMHFNLTDIVQFAFAGLIISGPSPFQLAFFGISLSST
jgi:hypothetical protein